MKIKKLNETPLTKVKNYAGCTNFGGIEIVGNKMYTIKTRNDNKLSVISEYPDYTKTARRNHKFANCLWHGNDLAYNNGFLYVAPCDKYVQLINTSNWDSCRLDCDVFVSAIAHVSGNQFVVLSYDFGNALGLTLVEQRGARMEKVGEWKMNNPKAVEGYSITQGIGFKKKNQSLFIVLSKNDFHQNVILRNKIGAPDPDYCFNSKRSQDNKYEFESISFLKNGDKVIASNLPGGDRIFIAK